MKIALLHDSVLPPKTYGGIERVVVSLAHAFKARGHEVVLVCKEGSNLAGFETVILPTGYQEVAPETWLPRGIDFLHAHQPLPIKPKIPFLVSIHGNGHEGENYWRNTCFLSASHARNHGAKYFIYNGVDPDQYPFVEKKSDYYVFLARASWRVKNVKTAIAWANDLGVRLDIMGGTGLSRGNIRYHGMVGGKQKTDLLAGAKALIYPTNWDEPCAVAPLEALACGTPVIASQNGCMPELVRTGTGVVCSSYDELLQAPKALEAVSTRACRKAVETYFSGARMADDYLALFEKIREIGELDHQPHYAFKSSSVRFLYKPTLPNRIRLALTGKI